jgi:7-cyano-7-deazaguanine synthase in queuosine biosynthesis
MPVEVVVLLSGGLDSAACALDLASRGDQRMYLLSFYLDRHDGPQQAVLREVRHFVGASVRHGWANPKVRKSRENSKRSKSSEDSNRSRGLLFATAGVLVAAASGVTTVQMPENGQMAINPSLTPARPAACSTKSVHPWVLWQLNRLIEAIGGDVQVVNPFLYLTKGEVCGIAYDALRRGNGSDADGVLAATISCGNRSVNRPRHNHCGYCFPCLVRRAGLRAALGTDPTTYATALQDLTKRRRKDLDDLLWWLETPFTTRDLLAEAPLPPDVDVDRLMHMLCRGREELRAMLDHAFPEPAKALAGGVGER